ncbi:MAG: polysaccharide deacetylase family protein [Planctomycetia bacterium]|nr:polysaccharide deacetylase family protein [Planctomycetia bacterium]
MKSFPLRFEPGAGPAWMAGREAAVFAEPGAEPAGRRVAFDGTTGKTVVAEEGGRLACAFDARAALEVLRTESYREPAKPVTRFLPFHYHRIPGGLRIRIGQALAAMEKQGFPRWPVDPSGDALRWLLGERGGAWPGGKKFALVLSHDVDTADGMEFSPRLLDIEAKHGVPAAYSFVTSTYAIDKGFLRAVAQAGGEIAWHSDLHDNRIAFEDEAAIRARLDGARAFLDEFDVRGFRSPSLCRTPTLLRVAAERFTWDSSIPDTGPGGGCASVQPFRVGKMLEVPLTLPMDADLVFRRRRPETWPDAWLDKARFVRDVGGCAVLCTHPETHFSGHRAAWEAYDAFLNRVKELDPWICVPRRIEAGMKEAA